MQGQDTCSSRSLIFRNSRADSQEPDSGTAADWLLMHQASDGLGLSWWEEFWHHPKAGSPVDVEGQVEHFGEQSGASYSPEMLRA